jgi:hypothetical protein
VSSCFIEEEKRRRESGLSAVGFVYHDNNPTPAEVPGRDNNLSLPGRDSNLSLPQQLSTAIVDHGEGDTFVPPPGLIIPEGIQVVSLRAH